MARSGWGELCEPGERSIDLFEKAGGKPGRASLQARDRLDAAF